MNRNQANTVRKKFIRLGIAVILTDLDIGHI
jgi:hypothetical protein